MYFGFHGFLVAEQIKYSNPGNKIMRNYSLLSPQVQSCSQETKLYPNEFKWSLVMIFPISDMIFIFIFIFIFIILIIILSLLGWGSHYYKVEGKECVQKV